MKTDLPNNEKSIAVRHWNRHQRPPLPCPYSEDHTSSSRTIDDEVVLYCNDCQAAVGFVPDYVLEFYEGVKSLGWVRPLPPPEIEIREKGDER